MLCVSPRGASRAPAALAAIAAAFLVGACSKGEPQQSGKARPNAPLEAPSGRPTRSAGGDEVDAALKERLARQDAAARMFERNVLEPAPPRVPEPPKALQPREPVAVPQASRESVKAESAPTKAAIPAPAAPPPSSPSSPVSKPAPAAAPRTDLAAVKTAPAVDPNAARLLTRVDPDFPAEALRSGVERGTVRARITLDAAGNATRVEVVEATPRHVFDRAVVRALSQWKFSEGASGRIVDSEVDFKR